MPEPGFGRMAGNYGDSSGGSAVLIAYESHTFRKQSRLIIDKANEIIGEYQAQGYDLTLRQLYYQFVARGIIPNDQREYDKLGSLISKARLAGLIDWDAIVDRTRPTTSNNHYDDPGDILSVAAKYYGLDTRATQDTYLEVWVEKEALLGVIEPICLQLDVTCLACRGYFSQSAMYAASRRFETAEDAGQKTVVLHLGDHDPSGLDMTRDLQERLQSFRTEAEVKRIALNMDQVHLYSPPPNFAKMTDTRSGDYVDKYGQQSWELDALDPKTITQLIEDAVGQHTDETKRQALIEMQESQKKGLAFIANNWAEIVADTQDEK
jgi:hypothetical protein